MSQILSYQTGSGVPVVLMTDTELGSHVLTDGWAGYDDLPKHGYTRIKMNLSESGNPAHVIMPGVHRIAALLKRWLLGIHQGGALSFSDSD